MKGIVLAGGKGSRLWPITRGISKQLVPIYDKPLIHYPIATLFLAGIREILIITNPGDQESFKNLLGDGSQYGVHFEFEIQNEPKGIAEAFKIGRKFIGNNHVSLVLGDNILYGVGLGRQLRNVELNCATIFSYHVQDPQQYGVIEIAANGRILSIEEKPTKPKSNLAIPGLYFFDSRVIEYVHEIQPSKRGELEITSLLTKYMQNENLQVINLERGISWYDAGSFDSLISAANFIKAVEDRQGFKVACLEEIAWRNGWISNSDLRTLANQYGDNPYKKYLMKITE